VSTTYRSIGWNRQKKAYDGAIVAGAVAYLALFIGAHLALRPTATIETILIRGFGTLAFLLLHIVLSIGPLCRLDARFLPLLYNRRHLGVTTFLCALLHGLFSLVQFHALGDVPALESLLTTSRLWNTRDAFPFQILGASALVILFAMAATSHDFWLRTLTPRIWKTLHMGVYLAYALLVAHVSLGALQAETDPRLAVLLAAGVLWIVALHLIAATREARIDRAAPAAVDGFVDVCSADAIPDGRARITCLGDERIAIFRYDGQVSAISNVCRHQNGPLGEGRIIRGCVVCPWHGYEYKPDTGASPPPFTERVETYAVQIRCGRVFVDPRPYPPGTRLEPARIGAAS
jgi:nitrite reductase/ring-hydroxylating ferredoxin subunit/DMSO/TMAO reductase YedYZ heme-binding membrane subunit